MWMKMISTKITFRIKKKKTMKEKGKHNTAHTQTHTNSRESYGGAFGAKSNEN